VYSFRNGRALLVTLALVALLTTASALTVVAADPTPTPGPSGLLIDPLDPRAGAGANRVGAPLLALVAVIGIGVVAAIATAFYVRVTRAR
jgi:hypothetical protein